jgi:hypothetical protein
VPRHAHIFGYHRGANFYEKDHRTGDGCARHLGRYARTDRAPRAEQRSRLTPICVPGEA